MRKWKVLIADDERMIREGIRYSVDWEKYGMEVIGEAEDGEEVIELAIEHQIDLLLIDLNMPIMDGIMAMKLLKEQLPLCKMLVISGYDEFHYAQEAIRLQVEDYILKPVNPEKLASLLLKLKSKLATEVNQQAYLKEAKNQMKKNHHLLKENFFQEWIDNELVNDEIKNQLNFLSLPITSPQQYLILRWPEYYENKNYIAENERHIFWFAIENIVEELLGPSRIVVFRDRSELLNVCLWKRVTSDQITTIITNVRKHLKISLYSHLEDIHDEILTDLYKIYDLCKIKVDAQIKISPLVLQAKTYVQEHYQDSSLTLEKVAENAHVSSVYVSRMIKQELGISYVALLTQLRVNKAADLLKTTDMTIREISEKVGYETQHYFSTTFKKRVGLTPNQFRK